MGWDQRPTCSDLFHILESSTIRTNNPSKQTKESRQLSSLDGALHLKLRILFSVHPTHWSHLLAMIKFNHRPPTRTPLAWYSQQRAIGGDMVSKSFDQHARSLVLFRLPLTDCQVAPPQLSPRGCDVTPLCHFKSFFDVLAFCSHFPSPSGIWFLTSLHEAMVQIVLLCAFFFVPASTPFSSDQCHTIFSAPNLLPRPVSSSHYGALFVHTSCVVLRSIAWIGSTHALSFNSSNSCFPAHLFQQTILACFRSIFFTSCGRTTLIFTAICPSNNNVCHSGHLMPRSRVSHMTAPAGPLTCLHASTSKICFLHAFLPFRPSNCGHGREFFLNFRIINLHEK